jgi:hypothetical protein
LSNEENRNDGALHLLGIKLVVGLVNDLHLNFYILQYIKVQTN